MKTLTLLASLILALTLSLHAAGGSVRLDVIQNVKTRGGGSKGTTTQVRTLVVTLNNISKVQMDNLAVKYTFFTRDAKGGNLSVYKEGEAQVSLKPIGRQVLTTDEVTSTYTVQHSEVTHRQMRGANGQQINVPEVRNIEASGQKIVAHAVRVFDGEKVVGEYYSEQSLKQKMAGPLSGNTSAPAK